MCESAERLKYNLVSGTAPLVLPLVQYGSRQESLRERTEIVPRTFLSLGGIVSPSIRPTRLM